MGMGMGMGMLVACAAALVQDADGSRGSNWALPERLFWGSPVIQLPSYQTPSP